MPPLSSTPSSSEDGTELPSSSSSSSSSSVESSSLSRSSSSSSSPPPSSSSVESESDSSSSSCSSSSASSSSWRFRLKWKYMYIQARYIFSKKIATRFENSLAKKKWLASQKGKLVFKYVQSVHFQQAYLYRTQCVSDFPQHSMKLLSVVQHLQFYTLNLKLSSHCDCKLYKTCFSLQSADI